MNAMTWYDHETQSMWSQPVGTALKGPYKGVRLEMIPVTVVSWSTWKKEHPNSLVLDPQLNKLKATGFNPFIIGPHVIGVSLGEHAKAYPFRLVSKDLVVNDHIGDLPVLVYANPDDKEAHVFVRRVGDEDLQFAWIDEALVDKMPGSVWQPTTGFALEGELKGTLLKELPYSTAYDWAWKNFYPDTEFYQDE